MLDMREKRRGLVGLSWCLARTDQQPARLQENAEEGLEITSQRGVTTICICGGLSGYGRHINHLRFMWLMKAYPCTSALHKLKPRTRPGATPHDTEIDSENWRAEEDPKLRRADR